MSGMQPATDDAVRSRFAMIFGGEAVDLLGVPMADLRAMLADVDAQIQEYVDLGFMTPAEAAEQ